MAESDVEMREEGKAKVEIREVSKAELGRHDPPADADDSWQESWGFAWHDPARKAGGINHISIWRNRGVADVWNWCALDGKIVGKYQNLKLPHPESDFPNWSLGGQTVTTESGRRCRLELEFEKASADLHYEAFTEPLAFSLDTHGSTWGSSHYESIGRVKGTVTADDGPVKIDGFAWQDHSWGPRRWADVLSHRWIMASFGPDFFVTALQVVRESTAGGVPIGFIYDHGTLHRVERGRFGSRIADDGHSPLGCDAHLWVDAGHGYHITGNVHTASPSSHNEGFWFTDGLAVFECGGRLGAGIFEVQEMKSPAPWHKELRG